jgi:hypothetical protein
MFDSSVMSILKSPFLFQTTLIFKIRKKAYATQTTILSACVSPFQLLSRLTDFHEPWYELYVTGAHPNFVLLNFSQAVKGYNAPLKRHSISTGLRATFQKTVIFIFAAEIKRNLTEC